MDFASETRQQSGGQQPLGHPFYPGWGERGGDEDAQHKWVRLCCPAEGSVDQETLSCRLGYLEEQHNLTGRFLTCPVTPLPSGPCSFTATCISTSDTALASTLGSVVPPLAVSPISGACSPFTFTASAWDTLTSTSRCPGCSDGDPVSAAAHLHLLGESLSLIGHHLQETDKVVCVPGSLSLLLDSLLCALAPLVSLTAQIPELRSCSQHNLTFTLENIAYLMPGL